MNSRDWENMARSLLANLAVEQRARQDAYELGVLVGYTHGKEAGYRESEEEWARHWDKVNEGIRRIRDPYDQRRAAELERARPKRTDYTGQLTIEQYMNGGAA